MNTGASASLPRDDSSGIRLVRYGARGVGWGPITRLETIIARCLGAEITELRSGHVRPWSPRRLSPLRARRSPQAPGAIFLARDPTGVPALAYSDEFRRPAQWRILWIIDSFYTDFYRDGPIARLVYDRFDLIAVMQRDEVDWYDRLAPGRVVWAGWGSDVLDLNRAVPGTKPVDVLRVGRQPVALEEDDRIAAACAARGLAFHGRPPWQPDGVDGPSYLADFYRNAKIVLASTNLVDRATNTHPTKEYLTGRWTDALAAGCVVAGQQPTGDGSFGALTWPGAVEEIDVSSLDAAMDGVARAVAAWTPEVARRNHLNALSRLDWRTRIADLMRHVDFGWPVLDRELAALAAARADAEAALART